MGWDDLSDFCGMEMEMEMGDWKKERYRYRWFFTRVYVSYLPACLPIYFIVEMRERER